MVELIVFLGAVVLAIFNEQPPTTVVLLEDPAGHVGQVQVTSSGGGAQTLNALRQSTTAGAATAPSAPTVVSVEEVNATFGRALKAEPAPPKKLILYFQTGGAVLTAESRSLLPEVLAEVRRRPAPEVAVVGHTDTVGSNAVNVRISTQRAALVRDFLVREGVDAKIIEVTSHGENNLLVKTPDNTPEPRNRRVEVTIR